MLELSASEVASVAQFRVLAEQCEPVVIRGLVSDWAIVGHGRSSGTAALAYLRPMGVGLTAEYFSAPADLEGRYHYGDRPGGFNFERDMIGVDEALNRIAANSVDRRRTGYVGSLATDSHFPEFAGTHPCPIPGSTVRPRIWIGNRSTVACHYDSYDNLACVAAGWRRFTLYPPDAIGDLYVGPVDHTLSGQPVSMVQGDADDHHFPRFETAKKKALTVDLQAGDALYLPKLWWHQVEATDPINILVNYWWDGFPAGPDSPYATMMLAMIAISERPDAERAAWRAYFDHYVFRPNGHPLAHLPEDRHGILGPLANGNYGRIRALVMRMLRAG